MSPKITPHEFVAKWRSSTLKERAGSQEHFIDICRLVGHQTPAEMDPTGDYFTFEAGATKTKGGQGWADVWKRHYFAWEYKGKHANLEKAYGQLLQYHEALESPPLLVVSDFDKIVIHTKFVNSVKREYTLTLDDLLIPENLAILKAVFFKPDQLRANITPEQVTQEAAANFAQIAELLRRYGEDPSGIAHFLIRLFFCLFAEDVGLLPAKLFTNLVEHTRTNPGAFVAQMQQLFQAMSEGGWFGSEEIKHFDGYLFDDATVLNMDSESMEILAKVCRLDWSAIEPSVLGTLFERSLDPSKRTQLGAHYTSREDILLIVEPVLMRPLRRRWDEVQEQAKQIATKRDATRGNKRLILQNQLSSMILGFAEEISNLQVLDPACGSGNFLYVALRQLLNLWKEVSTFAWEMGLPALTPHSMIAPSPKQLHGIEINEYAYQLAQATIWIGYIQWFTENGFGFPSEPILKPLDNILQMDAIIAYEQGIPFEPKWPDADIIIGNPPFLGGNKIRSAIGDNKANSLFSLYRGRVAATSDLVCYWFEKARCQILARKAKRAGLLATSSIRHSSNRSILDRILETGRIFWARSDMNWILDGADVRISMVAFDDGGINDIELDGIATGRINADLTSGIDITGAKKLKENTNLSFVGVEKAGDFDIDEMTAQEFLTSLVNPNQRPNSDVVKPCVNAYDLAERSRNMWIIDFGYSTSQAEAALYEKPFEHVKMHVKPDRDKNRRKSRKDKWWLFGETRPAMREAIKELSHYIVTPRVSRHRFFTWLDKTVVPQNKLVVIAREDQYFFGVLQSRIHQLWALAKAGRHGVGNDPAYSNDQCFETFPFPWPPGQEPQDNPCVQAIALAANELVEMRNAWLNPPGASEAELTRRTLTNLYNQQPTWLQQAHEKLDRAVFDANGWPYDLSDDQILERLLALNLERAKKQINDK